MDVVVVKGEKSVADSKRGRQDAKVSTAPRVSYSMWSFPETLDLKSAWYDATITELLAKFVRPTLTAYLPGFTPHEGSGTPTPPSSPPYFVCLGSALLLSTA